MAARRQGVGVDGLADICWSRQSHACEYGVTGIYAGVPAKLGKNGMEEVVELSLDDSEKKAFTDSCDILRGKAKELGLL